MNRIAVLSISLCLVFCISVLSAAAEISTFLVHEDTTHKMAVGPDGSIWLCLGHPPRIVKINGDSVEQVPFSGNTVLRRDWGADVYFSPSGRMILLEQGASDGVNCDRFAYYFDEREGLSYSGIIFPPATSCGGLLFDVEGKAYAVMSFGERELESSDIFELTTAIPTCRHRSTDGPINSALIVSQDEAWLGVRGEGVRLVNLRTWAVAGEFGSGEGLSEEASYPAARDSHGSLWLLSDGQIVTYSDGRAEVYAPGRHYHWLALADHEIVWAASDSFVARFTSDAAETYTVADGLVSTDVRQMLIDLDGNLWLRHPHGLTRITTGDLPPQRLSIYEARTAQKISAAARLENSGPPLWVDVYIAMELNGKILFWPFWEEAFFHYPVELLQGFGYDAVVLDAWDGLIAPGTYTFFTALAVRDSMRFVGGISAFEITVN